MSASSLRFYDAATGFYIRSKNMFRNCHPGRGPGCHPLEFKAKTAGMRLFIAMPFFSAMGYYKLFMRKEIVPT